MKRIAWVVAFLLGFLLVFGVGVQAVATLKTEIRYLAGRPQQ